MLDAVIPESLLMSVSTRSEAETLLLHKLETVFVDCSFTLFLGGFSANFDRSASMISSLVSDADWFSDKKASKSQDF